MWHGLGFGSSGVLFRVVSLLVVMLISTLKGEFWTIMNKYRRCYGVAGWYWLFIVPQLAVSARRRQKSFNTWSVWSGFSAKSLDGEHVRCSWLCHLDLLDIVENSKLLLSSESIELQRRVTASWFQLSEWLWNCLLPCDTVYYLGYAYRFFYVGADYSLYECESSFLVRTIWKSYALIDTNWKAPHWISSLMSLIVFILCQLYGISRSIVERLKSKDFILK